MERGKSVMEGDGSYSGLTSPRAWGACAREAALYERWHERQHGRLYAFWLFRVVYVGIRRCFALEKG